MVAAQLLRFLRLCGRVEELEVLVDADEAQAQKLGVAGQNWEQLFISWHHMVDHIRF